MTAQPPSPKAIDLSELMARKLEGLAQRVRDRAVIGFDLCWNLNQARQHPTLLVGVMLMQAHNADDFIDCLHYGDKQETPEAIQREVNQILESDKIQVEDHMAAENLITDDTIPGALPEDPTDEDDDYHVLDPDEDGHDDEGGEDE